MLRLSHYTPVWSVGWRACLADDTCCGSSVWSLCRQDYGFKQLALVPLLTAYYSFGFCRRGLLRFRATCSGPSVDGLLQFLLSARPASYSFFYRQGLLQFFLSTTVRRMISTLTTKFVLLLKSFFPPHLFYYSHATNYIEPLESTNQSH